MKTNYDQLCGALGVLKANGATLPWEEIDATMRDIGRRLGIAMDAEEGKGIFDPVHDEIAVLHRKYRKMCMDAGFIRKGELFDEHDCIPLI